MRSKLRRARSRCASTAASCARSCRVSSCGEHVALADRLAGLERDPLDDARQVGAHRDALHGGHRADGAQRRRPLFLLRDDRRDRLGRRLKGRALGDRRLNLPELHEAEARDRARPSRRASGSFVSPWLLFSRARGSSNRLTASATRVVVAADCSIASTTSSAHDRAARSPRVGHHALRRARGTWFAIAIRTRVWASERSIYDFRTMRSSAVRATRKTVDLAAKLVDNWSDIRRVTEGIVNSRVKTQRIGSAQPFVVRGGSRERHLSRSRRPIRTCCARR